MIRIVSASRSAVLALALLLWLVAPSTLAQERRVEARAVGALAIPVSDLERALAFYTRVLEFRAVSQTELSGPALERLEGLPGAHGDRGRGHRCERRVLPRSARPARDRREREPRDRTGAAERRARRVAAHHDAARTFRSGSRAAGVRSPSDGRPFPADVRSSDRVRWQTSIAIGDARAAEVRLSEACVPLVSAGLAEDPGPPGGARALVIADPDGHAILLRELAP